MRPNTTRLSVEIPKKDHKKLKILAEANELTLKDLVLVALEPILYPKKTPNATTRKAIEDAEKGTGLVFCEDIEDFWEKVGLDG